MIEIKFFWDLFLQALMVSAVLGTITMLFIQKTKGLLPVKSSWIVTIYSFVVNMGVGFLYGKNFTDATWIYCLWIGFFAFIGADSIYKGLEKSGLVKQFQSLKNSQTITVDKDKVLER